jgi:hypothetical protein
MAEVRGDQNIGRDQSVGRTGTFAKRADQGLNDQTISTSLVLTRHAEYYQLLNATTSNDLVVLPDATTLPEGWEVVILNDGAVALLVEDDTDTGTYDSIAVGNANRYILLDNGTAGGTWFVEPMDTAAVTAATRYTATFDATTDWGSASGGYYTITVTQATHTRGTTPSVKLQITDGGTGYNAVEPDETNVEANGDISFRVPDSPDLRFAGRIIVV